MRYKFDLNMGHYIKLNEDGSSTGSTTDATTGASTDSSTAEAKTFKGINQDDAVSSLKAKITDLNARHSREAASLDQRLNAAKQAVQAALDGNGAGQYTSAYDPTEVDQNVISIENQKLSSEKAYQDQMFSLNQQLLARKKALAAMTEANAVLPEKMHNISESTLNNNKIFLKSILYKDGPYSEVVNNMAAFNRLFKESGLLYGKDRKQGYYVICIDKDDFEILVKTLQCIGVPKREIMSEVMPQLMDRKALASM